jgi:CubicO group peptidase (beta-lactamase class C family)
MKRIIYITTVLLCCSSIAYSQNNKGQIETDVFWDGFSKGYEWLSNSKRIPKPSNTSDINLNKNEQAAQIINQVFDQDVHRIVIVAKGRRIISSKYNTRWVNENSRPASASMAKGLVALTVGKAICNGSIRSLDDEVGSYAHRLKGTSWGNATIRHLLAMSSGSHKPGFSLNGSPTNEVHSETIQKSYLGNMNHEFVSLMKRNDHNYSKSGEGTLYNNLDTIALSILVEDSTGEKFLEFFRKQLWEPIGASQHATWAHNSLGQVAAYSGFTAHPHDWLRIGNHIIEEIESGTCFGQYMREASREQSRLLINQTNHAPYGFQLWIGCGSSGSFCFVGHGGQRLIIYPNSKLIMYVHATSNTALGGLQSAFARINQFMN